MKDVCGGLLGNAFGDVFPAKPSAIDHIKLAAAFLHTDSKPILVDAAIDCGGLHFGSSFVC